MKSTIFILVITTCTLLKQDNEAVELSSEPFASFVSKTECPDDIRDFHNVTKGSPCQQINWKLDLLRNTEQKGSYVLTSEWVHYPNNWTDEVLGRNDRMKGTWKLQHGLKGYSRAEVYVLTSGDDPSKTLSLLKVNDNLLQILSADGSMSIGGGGYSNTLTRVNPVSDGTIDFAISGSPLISDKDIKAGKISLTGRTPSPQIAKEIGLSLPKNEPHDTPWPKIKWTVTLFIDPATGKPGSLEIRWILDTAEPVKGTWSVSQGWSGDKDAVIYKLDCDIPDPHSLYLVKGSEDVFFFASTDGPLMVGNEQFSYTLNRKINN
jgi:hypothetical protein